MRPMIVLREGSSDEGTPSSPCVSRDSRKATDDLIDVTESLRATPVPAAWACDHTLRFMPARTLSTSDDLIVVPPVPCCLMADTAAARFGFLWTACNNTRANDNDDEASLFHLRAATQGGARCFAGLRMGNLPGALHT